jgi:hypothetical protein
MTSRTGSRVKTASASFAAVSTHRANAATGSRSLISRISGKKPYDLKTLDRRYEKNATGDIFCDTRSREDVTDVVDKGEAPGGGRLFAFIPKPEPQAERMVKELMTRMSAEAVVDEINGVLRSFSATLLKAHKVNLFGEVKSATFSAICAALPNGRAYTARTDLNAIVSAMGGAYRQKTVQLISNVKPVG